MKTLGSHFRKLRINQSLDMADVSSRCKLDRSTISNIERDRPIRWETVHAALVMGLGVHVDSEAYYRCHQYWLDRRAEIAKTQPDGHAAKTLSRHATEAVRKFRDLIRNLDPKSVFIAFKAAQLAVEGAPNTFLDEASTPLKKRAIIQTVKQYRRQQEEGLLAKKKAIDEAISKESEKIQKQKAAAELRAEKERAKLDAKIKADEEKRLTPENQKEREHLRKAQIAAENERAAREIIVTRRQKTAKKLGRAKRG